jgi:plastocyanin
VSNRLHTTIGWILGLGALVFVLLLAGVFSGALTDDPPAVSPYASSGDEITTTTAGSAETTEAPIAADAASLTISGFAFGDPIIVPVGTEVTITNQDGASHTWTSTDGFWDSGSLGGGDSFSFTFTEARAFDFFCVFHPSMTGTITITG